MESTETNTATTNTVQERINETAQAMFQKDIEDAVKAIRDNPILSRLCIKIGEKDVLFFDHGSYGLFTITNRGKGIIGKKMMDHTNFQGIEKELIEIYARQQTDSLFAKFEEIRDFLENRPNDY